MGKKTSLEDALRDVTNKLDKIVERTAKEVSKKAMKDVKQETKKIVKHYYDSYRPKMYDRKYSLYHAYEVLDNTYGDTMSIIVEFDPSLLSAHKSNSPYHQTGKDWQPIIWPWEEPDLKNHQYGVPEPDWILDNFWEGIHPITYGSKSKGYTYRPAVDMKSPQDLFDEFVNGSYVNKVLAPYASKVFSEEVLKVLRKKLK